MVRLPLEPGYPCSHRAWANCEASFEISSEVGGDSKVVQLRDSLKRDIVVVGNGDVKSLSEVDEKVRTFGVDGVMMGRAIFENLYLFSRDSIPLSERSVSENSPCCLNISTSSSRRGERRSRFEFLKSFLRIILPISGVQASFVLRQ